MTVFLSPVLLLCSDCFSLLALLCHNSIVKLLVLCVKTAFYTKFQEYYIRFLSQSQPQKRQKSQFFYDFFAIFQKKALFLQKSEMFSQKNGKQDLPLSVLSTLSGKYPAVVKYPPPLPLIAVPPPAWCSLLRNETLSAAFRIFFQFSP